MIETLISWDGNVFAPDYRVDFVAGTEPRLPPVTAAIVERSGRGPLVGAMQRNAYRLTLLIVIEDDTNYDALRTQLFQWFDPDDETPKRLVADNHTGIEMYIEAICEELRIYGTPAHLKAFAATLVVHGDTLWRSTSEDQVVWSITASGQTRVVTNGGEAEAYPRFTIEPTGAKTGGYTYKRFIPVRWRVSAAISGYPVDIGDAGFDTATLVSAGKMQADGDDLRVWVDGVEVDRWLYGINTANTKVWVNLNWQAEWSGTIVDAMLAGDTITELDVNEDITGTPSSGTLIVDNEAFTYTSKNTSLQRFLGVTRAAKGTTAAGHAASAAVWWCQHDIWILYGNASASAPTVDDNYKPAFNLATSTNTSWDYDEFGEEDGLRTGAWTKQAMLSTPTFYTANRGTDADPWQELGIQVNSLNDIGIWKLYNPCSLSAANFQNGEKYRANTYWRGQLKSSLDGSTWNLEYSIPSPSAIATWESWSQNETLIAGSKYVALYLEYLTGTIMYLEAADVTVALDSSYTPTIIIGSEQGNYSLACTLTNQTTGESIGLDYTMALSEDLEVDTDAKTVIDLEDDSSQFQALTLTGGARRDWLPLQPGSNTLRFDDTGTNGVTVTVEWEERYYA